MSLAPRTAPAKSRPTDTAPATDRSRPADLLAAIDMGSNSFRLEIAQVSKGKYKRIDYLKETVRLGAGLDSRGMLTEEDTQRGHRGLGWPIEVVSGREEARLIYQGVSRLQPSELPRLVIDIGGRSTKMILGTGRSARQGESFAVGSVSLSIDRKSTRLNSSHMSISY